MNEPTRPHTGHRTLTDDERLELLRLIAGGRWRLLGSARGE